MTRTLQIAAAALMAAALAPAPVRAELLDRTLEIGGVARSYVLHRPDGTTPTSAPLPLMIVLHGGSGWSAQIMRHTGMNDHAQRRGFMVAYPQGIERAWNDGRIFRGRTESPADDVAFIRAVIADIARDAGAIDRGRIFAAGISNGGFMSLRLACDAADLFVGIAVVAATLPADIAPRCRPAAPVSVLLINGTADPMVPYEGGQVRVLGSRRGAILSTAATLAFWAQQAGCAGEPQTRALPDRDPGDGSVAVSIEHAGCVGAQARLLRIEGGGHTWPGGGQYLPSALIGRVNRDIDASAAIVDFFFGLAPR